MTIERRPRASSSKGYTVVTTRCNLCHERIPEHTKFSNHLLNDCDAPLDIDWSYLPGGKPV
jgi:hypothetical protein